MKWVTHSPRQYIRTAAQAWEQQLTLSLRVSLRQLSKKPENSSRTHILNTHRDLTEGNFSVGRDFTWSSMKLDYKSPSPGVPSKRGRGLPFRGGRWVHVWTPNFSCPQRYPILHNILSPIIFFLFSAPYAKTTSFPGGFPLKALGTRLTLKGSAKDSAMDYLRLNILKGTKTAF